MSADDDDPLRRVRLDKLETLRGMGIDPYPVSFSRSDEAAALDQRYSGLAVGAETNDQARVAGRIRAMRNNGMFIDLHDASGKIQIFSHKDFLTPDQLALLRLFDIGDLIGVEGRVRRTALHRARSWRRNRRSGAGRRPHQGDAQQRHVHRPA